jgi:hypothetical protein
MGKVGRKIMGMDVLIQVPIPAAKGLAAQIDTHSTVHVVPLQTQSRLYNIYGKKQLV